MISTREIKDKEVINILTGKSIGYVSDIEINLDRGRVDALVVPAQRPLLSIFSGADEVVIPWKNIKKIGEDVILAEVQTSFQGETSYEQDDTEESLEKEESSGLTYEDLISKDG